MKRNNFMTPNVQKSAAVPPRKQNIQNDPFTNFPPAQNQVTSQNSLAPYLNQSASKPILSNRPVSAYVRSTSFQNPPSNQGKVSKLTGISKAQYSFAEQIQDLQQKELNLEKARTDLYLCAEEQRHKNEMAEIERNHDQHIEIVKTQNESQLNLQAKEHQNEITKLTH